MTVVPEPDADKDLEEPQDLKGEPCATLAFCGRLFPLLGCRWPEGLSGHLTLLELSSIQTLLSSL